MSRTLTGALPAHLATRRTTLARCLRLDLIDGTSLGFTSHNKELIVDLGDGPFAYSPSRGITPSAVSLSLGWDADSFEVTGPIDDVMTRQFLLGGRGRGARARQFDVNWRDVTQYAPLVGGKTGTPKVEGGRFRMEILGHGAAYNQTIGRVASPYCDADFGDARCGGTPQTWAAEVTAVNSGLSLELTFTGATPTAEEAQAGEITFTTGDLVGTYKVEVFRLDGTTLSLYVPLVQDPQVGDTLILKEGCSKLRSACIDHQGHAKNHRGFPDFTGNDELVQFGASGDGT